MWETALKPLLIAAGPWLFVQVIYAVVKNQQYKR